MSRAVSVQWARPTKQSKLGLGVVAVCIFLDGLYVRCVSRPWGTGASWLSAGAVVLFLFWVLRKCAKSKPKPKPIEFQAEQASDGLRLSKIRNWSEAESLCNYFSKEGIYPAIDLPSRPPDCRLLLMGLTMESFASMLEGAIIEPIQRRQAA